MILNKRNFLRWDGDFTINDLVSIIFQPVTSAEINTLYESNSIVIAGLSSARPISVSGNEAAYQLNGGAWTSLPGAIQNNDVLKVRGRSSLNFSEQKVVSVTIGTSSGNYSVTTKAATPSVIQFSLSYTTIVSSIRAYKGLDTIISMDSPDIQNYNANAGDSIRVSSNSVAIPVNGFRKTEINENGVVIYTKTETVSNTPSEYIISIQSGKNYTVIVTTGTTGDPVTNKYFNLSQIGRRLSVSGPNSIVCPININIGYIITYRDSSGNPTGESAETFALLTLPANETVAYTANITANGFDTIEIIAFNFTPDSCSGDLIYVNGQPGTA